MIITHRNGSVITDQYASAADAVQAGVNLWGADLWGADLTGALISVGNRQVTL